jgi:glycosyltransferase involved in cell wall biosynthesis
MRYLLIVDPSLKSYEGHSWNYDRAVYEASAGFFSSVELFADYRFDIKNADIPVQAVFNHIDLDRLKGWTNRFFHTIRPRGVSGIAAEAHATVAPGTWPILLRLVKHLRAFDFGHNIRRIVRSREGGRELHLFVQHAHISELLVAHRWLRSVGRSGPRFHIVLRYAPELVNVGFMQDAAFAKMLSELADKKAGNARFYTDSDRLSRQYEALTGCHVTTLPIPVPASLHLAGEVLTDPGQLTLGFLGSSRVDKGFDQLPEVIAALPGTLDGQPVRALVQVTRGTPDPRVQAAISRLCALSTSHPSAPAVEMLESPAPMAEYYNWFRRVCVNVLPYVSRKYEASTSGILVESILSGVPVVVPAGSWMGDQVDEARNLHGLRIGETFGANNDLKDAIFRVAREAPLYRAHVRSYEPIFRAFHNPKRLAAILAGSKTS